MKSELSGIMNTPIKYREIYICGDTHGNFNPIIQCPKNSLVVHVGDCGCADVWVNFSKLRGVNRILRDKGINLYINRGNHSDPSYWSSWREERAQLSNITFVNDGYHTIQGHLFFFIGGAISVDRVHRKVGKTYWLDEGVSPEILNKVYQKPIGVDLEFVISHTWPKVFPIGFSHHEPIVTKAAPFDPTLIKDLEDERALVEKVKDELFRLSKPKMWLGGHMHSSQSQIIDECKFQLLNIDEIVQIV